MGAAESIDKPAFHIMKIADNSPADIINLKPYFDYIVAINDTIINENLLMETTKDNIGKEMKLAIYNSKEDSFREVFIVPSVDWGGSGLLGLSVRFCSYHNAADRIWHILDIQPNSPAEKAGLKPFTDYFLGSEMKSIEATDDITNLLTENMGKPVTFIVYSAETDSIRTALVIPDLMWGGNGCLGCDIGHGALHRLTNPKLSVKASGELKEGEAIITEQEQGETQPEQENQQGSQKEQGNNIKTPQGASVSAARNTKEGNEVAVDSLEIAYETMVVSAPDGVPQASQTEIAHEELIVTNGCEPNSINEYVDVVYNESIKNFK